MINKKEHMPRQTLWYNKSPRIPVRAGHLLLDVGPAIKCGLYS